MMDAADVSRFHRFYNFAEKCYSGQVVLIVQKGRPIPAALHRCFKVLMHSGPAAVRTGPLFVRMEEL